MGESLFLSKRDFLVRLDRLEKKLEHLEKSLERAVDGAVIQLIREQQNRVWNAEQKWAKDEGMEREKAGLRKIERLAAI